MSAKNWGFSKNDGPPWPHKEDGEPVAPAYLAHLNAVDFEGQIVRSMLTSAGIPVVVQYPNNGEFGRIILGFSGTGLDLYVPETMLEDAQGMLTAEFEEAELEEAGLSSDAQN